MSLPENAGPGPVQTAEAQGNARVTQVGGNYEKHVHRYVRGWQYLRGTSVGTAELDLAEHAFVDPSGHGGGPGRAAQAVSKLTRPYGRSHVLVLCGEAGSGRRTTALHVLLRVGVARERLHWLSLDWDQPRTEQIPATKGHGFVLDLTNGQELSEDFYTGLADYQKEAEDAEAFLIILADTDGWNAGAAETVPVVHLVRPQATQVAEEHLRHRAADRMNWLNSPPLDTLLTEGASAADAARLARLIAHADDGGQEAVQQEFTGWRDHLTNWFKQHSEPEDVRERALLVSAAVLERVPAQDVLEAADRLFAEVGGVLPPGGPLAGRDLQQRLLAVKASLVDGERISLDADRHGLSEAVLAYVWQQRPQLRGVLLRWASQISAPNGTAVRHLQRIADCLVRLSLLPGGATVRTVVTGWIDTGRPAHRQLAIDVLEKMALHPDTGVRVRRLLYEWAQQKTISKDLLTAVAEICAGRLGRDYPRVALTRLRVLASRQDSLAREAVADAVHVLASTPEQRVPVLSEVVDWAESTSSTTAVAGADTFLALTDISGDSFLPLPAQQEPADSAAAPADDLFVRGWRAALNDPSTSTRAHTQLAAWLDSASLSDDQVLPLAAAVLRGRLDQAGAAELLVGSSSSSGLGRTRRKKLLDLLIGEQASFAATAPAPAPVAGSESDPTTR
ncbi:hypothetical protein GCM10010451_38170 [Streptomyces virens]|uniref:ATP-binding protein n=1 Tax=Streptomyces virens TaxID=285572 RepID=A0ABP6PPD7_9ACTN|nr:MULTISPECIES: hypothetical protein [Streptomyces]MBA8980271.1 hypothetical protein [Streptomyces calvus]